MKKLTDLERRVLEMLLNGGHPLLTLLRRQVEHASVKSRQLTGVGFFTDFKIPEKLRITGSPSFQLTDVIGSAKNVKEGVGFVLFVTDGLLSMLEGYTYNEPWPTELQSLELMYLKSTTRDFSNLPAIPYPN